MVQQTINIGAAANDGTGDTWRAAMDKSNDNFTELFDFDATINTVFITQESDFPTQDASTITLDALTVFVVSGTFTTAKKFTCNNGSVLTANNQFGHSITYSGVGSMFTGLDANFTIEDITVSCPNAQAFDFDETVGGTTIFLAINISVSACTKWGTYDNPLAVDISGSNSPNAGDGITLIGSSTLVLSLRQVALISSSATFKGVDLGTSVSANIEFSNLIIVAPAGAFGISGLANSGNVPVGSIAMVTNSSFIGGVTDLQNITTGDIRWSFKDNSPTEDSKTIGSAFVKSNAVATTITTSNTFNDIDFGALSAGSNEERFTLTNAVTGELRYDGERPFSGEFAASISAFSTGGSQGFRFRLVKNGVVQADDIETEIEIGSNLASTVLLTPVTLVQNDLIRPQVTRNAGTSTITVKHYSAAVR